MPSLIVPEKTESASAAPALSRGLTLIGLLADGRPRGLEEIVRQVGWPKASVFRLLEVLVESGVVEKDETRNYRGLQALIPLRQRDETLARRQVMAELAAATRQTVEWWTPGPAGLVMIEQRHPEGAIVLVRAAVGFVRPWDGEMEAVIRVGRAFASEALPPLQEPNVYSADDVRESLTPAAAEALVGQTRAAGWAIDPFLNGNGVRRAACPVRSGGRLRAVLALAGHLPLPKGQSAQPPAELLRAAETLGQAD